MPVFLDINIKLVNPSIKDISKRKFTLESFDKTSLISEYDLGRDEFPLDTYASYRDLVKDITSQARHSSIYDVSNWESIQEIDKLTFEYAESQLDPDRMIHGPISSWMSGDKFSEDMFNVLKNARGRIFLTLSASFKLNIILKSEVTVYKCYIEKGKMIRQTGELPETFIINIQYSSLSDLIKIIYTIRPNLRDYRVGSIRDRDPRPEDLLDLAYFQENTSSVELFQNKLRKFSLFAVWGGPP